MPEGYRCTNCHLAFPVGQYVSYQVRGALLPCAQCGTAHGFEKLASTNWTVYFFHLGEPFFEDDDKATERGENDEGKFINFAWYVCPPNFEDWLPGGKLESEKLTDLQCVYCQSNSLVDAWEETTPCPSCGSRMERKGWWIT
jgi:hypothetical protein